MASKEQEFTVSFPLDLGMDNVSLPTTVQPFGEGAKIASSVNTRLTKVRGVPVKCPTSVLISDGLTRAGDDACGGVIPCGYASSSLVVRRPRYGSQRINGSTLTSLSNLTSNRNFWPADVTQGGPLPGSLTITQPAICLLDGATWMARAVNKDGSNNIECCVIGADGEITAVPTAVVTLATTTFIETAAVWIGLTAHGANGVRLWYRDSGSNLLKIATLSTTDGRVSVSGTTTLYTSFTSGTDTYDVCAQSDTYAWAVTLGPTAGTEIAIHKVDVTSNTVTTTTVRAAMGTAASTHFAIAACSMSAADYVAVVAALVTGTSTFLLYTAASAAVHTVTGEMYYGEPAVGFYRSDATEYVVYGCSDTAGSITTTFAGTARTQIQFRALTAGATLANTITLPWFRFASKMRLFQPAAGEIYPMFLGVPCWDETAQIEPTNPEYMSDPARTLYMIENNQLVTAVGRFAVNRSDEALYCSSGLSSCHNANSLAIEDTTVVGTYLVKPASWAEMAIAGWLPWYFGCDFASRQPRYAIGPDGTALIAGALPAYWDGVAVGELCPMQEPKITAAASGGAGGGWLAGNYLLSCVEQWRDATGTLHRGASALLHTLTIAAPGDKPIIYVSVPSAVLRPDRQVIVYASQVGGTVLYAQRWTISSSTAYVSTYDASVLQPEADDKTPAMYSTGAAGDVLEAQQVSGWWDVAIISNRAWVVLGERRSVVAYSKPKLPGIFYEFSSDQEITLPPLARKAMAVVEISGSTAVLCQGGAWLITGPGPDATLDNDAAFNPPEQITDIACTSRESVVRTPVGVMFISGNRFAVIGGGGAQLFDEIDASGLGDVCPVLLRDTQEVVWFGENGTHVVFNYSLGRWTQWNDDDIAAVTAGAYDPIAGMVFACSDDASIQRIDPASSSTTAQMQLRTGWMLLGGPEDDNAINDVIVRCQSNQPHGLSVTLETDFGASAKTATWTDTEIAACVMPGSDEYTLCMSPPSPTARVLRVTLTTIAQAVGEATGDTCRPIAVTVCGVKNRAPMRSAIRAQGRK